MVRPQAFSFILTVLMAVFLAVQSQAQERFAAYFEPSIDLSYHVSPKYTHSFGVENRNIVYRQGEMDYHVKQIDLSHMSEYQVNSQYAFGIGLQYRLEQAFDGDEENEFRLQEKFIYIPQNSNYKTKHRFKLEQRIYASETKHRLRYGFGVTFPISDENGTQPYLKVDTESLMELAKSQKPEFEQRLGLGIGWSLNSKTKVEFSGEFQLEDYTQDLIHELFLLVNLGITL